MGGPGAPGRGVKLSARAHPGQPRPLGWAQAAHPFGAKRVSRRSERNGSGGRPERAALTRPSPGVRSRCHPSSARPARLWSVCARPPFANAWPPSARGYAACCGALLFCRACRRRRSPRWWRATRPRCAAGSPASTPAERPALTTAPQRAPPAGRQPPDRVEQLVTRLPASQARLNRAPCPYEAGQPQYRPSVYWVRDRPDRSPW